MSAEAAQSKKAGAKGAATPKLAGDELKEAIKSQVEFYFSRTNLANDAFLVSQMNSQMYVPVETIVGFGKIKQLTNSPSLVVEAVLDSKVVTVNETKDAIKPNVKSERNTIILREIPSATAPEEVKAIFAGCGDVVNVRSDVGDTWFVTMESEDAAVKTLLALRSKTFNDSPIKARLKSENVLKSFYPAQVAEPVMAVGGAYSRGYYAPASGGYYDMANNYSMPYGSGHGRGQYHNGAADGGRYGGNRGGRGAGAAPFRQNKNHANQQHQQSQPKEARAKSNSFDQQRPGSRKAKDKKAKAAQTASSQAQSNGSTKRTTTNATERQPVLNVANFPPLPIPSEKPADIPQVEEIRYKYAHEDILEIVKHMDENDCTLADGKMDYEAHSAALTSVAHPDLLRNQRTYSIEQARDALRQGRPIRSDSIGSIDYESMMYGEDYTTEARKLRQQKEEAVPVVSKPVNGSKEPTAATTAAAQVKALGYAAAVINGTPAPQPSVDAGTTKKVAAKTPTKAGKASKDDKKPTKKAASDVKTSAADTSLPKSGAWGGRNFLDVVKSEPVNAPPAPVTTQGNAKQPDQNDGKDRRLTTGKQ